MKKITNELSTRLSRAHVGLVSKSVKWNEIYDNEHELINDMVSIDVTKEDIKGYTYIKSFQNQYNVKRSLSEKQMTQLKRLAYEIAWKKYVHGGR